MARRHSQWLAKRIRGGFAVVRSLWRRPVLGSRTTSSPRVRAKLTLARSRERAREGVTSMLGGAKRVAAVTWRLWVVCLRQLIAHRRIILGGLLRLGWWSALVLLVTAGPVVFEPTSAQTLDQVLPLFYLGVGLCAAVLLVAASRHLRWAAAGLALVHGTLAVAVVTALGAPMT